ncbi:hypothetical protein BLS_008191 [Venturia inaequalis]|uniref:Uncharacterized protein n=1 Tax=Venturia inaequalis TaxID=5025 RepID=A0A8H3U6S3_VENIN|nr:hypothetical protein BLS_008191 [Venturia inaequalis]
MQPSGTDRPVSQDVEMPMAENAAAMDQLIRLDFEKDFEKAFRSDLEVSYMFMSLPGFEPRAVALGRVTRKYQTLLSSKWLPLLQATAERAECRLKEEFAAFMTHYFIPYHRSITSSVREEHVAYAAYEPGRAESCHSESSKAWCGFCRAFLNHDQGGESVETEAAAVYEHSCCPNLLCLHRFPVITTSGILDDEGAFATLVDNVAAFWEYVSSTRCCRDVQVEMDDVYVAQFCEPSNGFQGPEQHDSRDRWSLRIEGLDDFVQKTFSGAFPGPVPRDSRTNSPWELPSFHYGDACTTRQRMFLKHVAQLVGRVFTAFLMTPGCPLDSERRHRNELAYMEEAVRKLVPLSRPSSRSQVGLGAPEAEHQPTTQGEPQTDGHALATLRSQPDTVLTSTPSSSTLSSSTTSSHPTASSVGCSEEGRPSVFDDDDDEEEACDDLYSFILRPHEPQIASLFYGAEAWRYNASIKASTRR